MTDLFYATLYLIKLDFDSFIKILNSIPIEISWFFFLIFCFSCIIFFVKFFGEVGLYIYTVIAIIAANIQVLKIVKFSFFIEPIALGTILFSSTFLCTDILSEYFGRDKAKKNIVLGFVGFLFMSAIMLFTLGFHPLDSNTAGEDYSWALETQDNLMSIFLPFPTFFIASMLAYLVSQYFDVWFFHYLSKITNKKFLWFRNNVSTMVSSLLDNIIFSLFAFVILSNNPLSLSIVITTYIFGTYIMRIVMPYL